ncbi:AB1IP protein, partial [Polypterus senegalus]
MRMSSSLKSRAHFLRHASHPRIPVSLRVAFGINKISSLEISLSPYSPPLSQLVVKVIMTDNSSKTLMVDETQTVRDILDNLFEKTHCDCNVDWCLYEENTYLQIERIFEDHENMVECLSQWTRDSENRILFIERKDKYAVFKNPQNFYFGRKEKKEMKEKDKESLLEENFCGTSIIVPDLEGALYLKEDGKKSWKQRYFLLRASGIYYVPKGKTKELFVSKAELKCLCDYYFDGKGKALRPMIVVLMARACNFHSNKTRELLPGQRSIAMISEMIHTASLVHDDVIDGSCTRRGKTTVNEIWGERKAILAGDFILSVASMALARIGNNSVVSVLSQVIEDLVRDDMLDFTSSANQLGKPSAADLRLGLATGPVLFACQQFPELHAMIMRRFSSAGDVERAWQYVMQSDGVQQTSYLASAIAKKPYGRSANYALPRRETLLCS